MSANDPLAELESMLPLLTPDELRLAEALLTPTAAELVRALPDDVLTAAVQVYKALQVSRGAPPAGIIDTNPVDAVFLGPDGAVLHYEEWYDRATGRPLTAAQRKRLHPFTLEWRDGFGVTPEDVLALLPAAMREAAAAVFAGLERERRS
jgi:hypothetical protein